MENIIEEIRKKKDVSRLEMSRQSGIPYPTLNVIAGGGVSGISYRIAKKIGEYAGIKPIIVQESYRKWREEGITKIN